MRTNRAREQTRTEATVKSYLQRAASILSRIADEMMLPEDAYPPPEKVVEYMQKNAHKWKWSAFRQMQASLVCRYELEYEKTSNQLCLSTAEQIRTLAYTECVPENQVGQTSSRKRKGVPKKDYDLLVANLSHPRRGGKYPQRAALWLMAATATGLRPCEWENARLDEVEGGLIVQNAKATNGRANGKERFVPVEQEDIPVIRAHLESIREVVKEGGVQFGEYHDACSQALNRACKYLWGSDPAKRYALYSARHQFSANRKAVDSQERVAELLGHKNVRTARRHYAPRRSAWAKYREASKHVLSNLDTPKQGKQ